MKTVFGNNKTNRAWIIIDIVKNNFKKRIYKIWKYLNFLLHIS